MDLDLSPEQELLRDTVRGLCARYADLAVVRRMEDDRSATRPSCGRSSATSACSACASPRSSAGRP